MKTPEAANDKRCTRRPRILFIAEAVTLAHVARPAVLAQSLDPTLYEVYFASDPRYSELLPDVVFAQRQIHSIPGQQVLEALAKGRPVYDVATLQAYVREDLKLLREIRPDVVVGDFRLSLAVSARHAGILYLAICNAYWSPYASQQFPLPELPFTRWVGLPIGRFLFRIARPLAFARHAVPLNRVRQDYDLPGLGFDLRRTYTEADHALYADIPELVPTFGLPANHHYLGPILWSPAVNPPAWWGDVPADRPVIYVTLGSSGQSELLETVLEALSDLPVFVIAATAGRSSLNEVPANARLADYLPGCAAAKRASIVICNGGSPTTQQALAAGTPLLGIASNLDQFLNMEAVRRVGAGELLRAGSADEQMIRGTTQRILSCPGYGKAARQLAGVLANYDAPNRFQLILGKVLKDAQVLTQHARENACLSAGGS
jgi:UDP:flavonoid glycosyltransferase YjiC (YdhE family)